MIENDVVIVVVVCILQGWLKGQFVVFIVL